MGMMIVTPIGTTAGNVGSVSGAYVKYLEGVAKQSRALETDNPASAPVRYYNDSVEGPGTWFGQGAARLGLAGEVNPDILQTLLSGRHHETGERLLTAQGSAGRSGLKVGEATRLIDGKPVWDLDDAAAKFDLGADELANHLATAGITVGVDGDTTSYLDRDAIDKLTDVIEADGGRYRALRSGDSNDQLTPKEAGELLGVTDRYVRRLAARHAHYEKKGEALPESLDYIEGERKNSRWTFRRGELIAFDQRRNPPSVRLAYDVTFTTEKSVSLLGLLQSGRARDIVTNAVIDANNVGLTYLEHVASAGRARGQAIGSEGLVVASYMHATSRNQDPFLHMHNVVLNSIEDANGDGRALDGRNLYLHVASAAALATAQQRWDLSQNLGVRWQQSATGVWEIEGITNESLRAFSTRRTEIMSLAAELKDKHPNLDVSHAALHQIALESRNEKSVDTVDDLEASWWETAQTIGLTPEGLADVMHRQLAMPSPQLSPSEHSELLTFLAGEHGATANESVITHSDVVKAILRWTPTGSDHIRLMPAATVEGAANDFLTSGLVVPLDITALATTGLRHNEYWTTKEMVQIQQRIANTWTHGHNSGGAVVTHETLNAVFAERPTITNEQRDLVSTWTQSEHRYQGAIGRPGTGKTYAMETAARAWESAGYTVLGAAVKGEAARHLGTQAHISSDTIAAYLADYYDRGLNRLDARTVLIVDEAGTLGDRQLDAVLTMADQAGATVRFIGDPAQHGSVDAGGMWAHLATQHQADTPELTINHRLSADVDIHANELIRRGEIGEAFDTLAAAGQLHEVHNRQDAMRATLYRYFASRDANQPAPMVERSNYVREVLNEAAQTVRIDRGEVTNPITYQHRTFGTGDEIVAKAPNRELHPNSQPDLYVRNGSTGTVTATHDDHLTIDFDDIGTLDVPATAINTGFIDLSYSLTSLGVQGATFPLSHSAISVGATQNEVVVNMSRGKHDNVLVVVGNNTNELQPFREPDSVSLAQRVAQSVKPAGNGPAIASDPAVAERNANLARLNYQGGIDEHGAPVAQQLARHLAANPPQTLVAKLPARSHVPHLRIAYDDAIVAAGTYAAIYLPLPDNHSPWGDTIGKAPNAHTRPNQRDQWDQAIHKLTYVSAATTLRNLTTVTNAPTVETTTTLDVLDPPTHTPKTPIDPGPLQHAAQHYADVSNAIASDLEHDLHRGSHRLSDRALHAQARAVTKANNRATTAQHITHQLAHQAAENFDPRALHNTFERITDNIGHDLNARQRWYATVSTDPRSHPETIDNAYNNARAVAVQHHAAQNVLTNLEHHVAHAPNPRITQREQTIAHQTTETPADWLTQHIHQLASNNLITPNTSMSALAEWASNATIYHERYGTNPLTTPTNFRTQTQANEHAELAASHSHALNPQTPTPQHHIDIPQPAAGIEIG